MPDLPVKTNLADAFHYRTSLKNLKNLVQFIILCSKVNRYIPTIKHFVTNITQT